MTLLSGAAAIVLLAFLAWSARRNPLFLAGAAAFLALGPSAFIGLVPDQVATNTPVLPVMTGDVIFAAVALGWLYARRRRRAPRVRLSARWGALGVFLAAFVAVELAASLANAAGFHPGSMLGTLNWFYIPFGYLMTLDILRRFAAEEVLQYLRVLCLFTTCLTVLYIASAFGVPIYPYPKSYVAAYGDATIIRDFVTLPCWLALAWCYYLSHSKRSWWTFAALAVLAGGALASYTRSLILVLLATAVLAAVLFMVHRGQRSRALVIGVAGAALAVAVFVGGPALAPAQYGFLMARFGSAERLRGALTEPNVVYRIDLFQEARVAGSLVDPVFGAGLFGAPALVGTGTTYNSYDSDWIRIVYYAGWAGVVVFLVPLLLPLWWGTRAFFERPSSTVTGTLLLTGVLVTVLSFALRFTGISYFFWPALSLFSVALIAYAAGCPVAGAAAASGSVHPREEPARLTSGL